MDINTGTKEFVAAYANASDAILDNNGGSLKSATSEKKDIYALSNANTIIAVNSVKAGDAMVETSDGKTEKSAWYNSTSVVPTNTLPFITRNTNDSVFGYSNS